MQRQYGALMRKHTVLQSTLLDMQCELAEQRKRAEDTAASPTEGGEADMVEMAGSPGTMRTKTDRGFSDAEVLSSANGFSPTGTSDVAGADGRYSGRGVQNTTRKDRKDKKDDKPDKKDKKSPGIRGIRGFV